MRLRDGAMRRSTLHARRVGRRSSRLYLTILAEIDGYRGEVEKARREIPDLLRVAERAGYGGAICRLTRSLALLELSCGDAAASWRQVEPHFADLEELDDSLAQLAGSVAIEALIAIGDLRTAERLLMLLDDYAAEADTAVRPLAASLPWAPPCRARRLRAGDRCARSGGRRARPAATSEPVRARPDATRTRNGAAQGAAQARRARVAATGGRDLRATRRAPLVGAGALGARGGSVGALPLKASSRRPNDGSSSSSSPAAGTARSPTS